MKEWLDSYNTDPERAQKALEELETAFDMPYMGEDRCDDATRNYLRENIDKAKLGDTSGFMECIEVNYANYIQILFWLAYCRRCNLCQADTRKGGFISEYFCFS